MKLVYIANARFPTGKAHGIQIAKMCEALVASGVDLTLVVPRRGKWVDPFLFYRLTHTFEVKRIWAPDFFLKTRFGFLFSALVFAFSSGLYVLFHRNNDVTYSIDIDRISFLGVLCGRRPRVFEMHAPRSKTLLNQIWFNNIEGIMAINETVAKELESNFGALQGKALIAPNGVDLSSYEGLEKNSSRLVLGLPSDAHIVVYTGSAQSWKGIDTIVKAACNLPSLSFYFVGGAQTDIEKLGYSVPSNMHFVGKRDFKEMPLWHTSADILLVTGTQNDEYSYKHTSPMKLFEYMAARRPIVATKTPAIEHVVTEKEVFFHAPDNADDLKCALNAALQNPDEKVYPAYKKAQELSWDNRARKVIQFIKSRTSNL